MAGWKADEGVLGLVLNRVKKLRLGCNLMAGGTKAIGRRKRGVVLAQSRVDGPARVIRPIEGLCMMDQFDDRYLRDEFWEWGTDCETYRLKCLRSP